MMIIVSYLETGEGKGAETLVKSILFFEEL